jgi:iron complex outermembrane recepter protein
MSFRHLAVTVSVATGSLLGALAATPVHAQAATNASEASSDSSSLEEVVVTARRRTESLQDTPVSVSSVSVAGLEAKQAVNLGDLQGAVPNLLITQQSSGAEAANLSLRGLTFADIEKSFDPTVAVVVDGVYLGTSTGQYLDFFDVSDLEVLRGPQGTLFGRNTIGGVINITRTRPTGEFGANIEYSYGHYGDQIVRSVFNAPIVDSLAMKLFYFDSRSDGFLRDYLTGGDRGGYHNQTFGATFLLNPKDSNLDVLLTLEKAQSLFDTSTSNITNSSEAFGAIEQPIAVNRNVTNDLYTVFSTPSMGEYHAPAVTLNVNWTPGPVKITSVTGYRSSHEDQTQDFDSASEALLVPSLAPLYYAHRIQDFHQFSEEVRGSGQITSTLDYVVGVYYYNSGYILTQYTNILGAGYGLPQVASGSARSVAAFADFDWNFYDRWRLNFGGRETQDKKSLLNYDPTFLGNPSATFTKFTPKIELDFRPTPDYMIYASESEGYRSGGYSNRAATVTATNTAFQPEDVWSSEVGVKSQWFDRRLDVNIAYFDSQYRHMQQTTTIPGGPTGNQTIVSNVGSAVIRGVELEVTGRPSQGLILNGSVSTLSSHFDNFVTGGVYNGKLTNFDYSGVNLIYAPTLSITANADYKIPTPIGEILPHVGYRFIASYDQQVSIGPTQVAPDGTVIVLANDPRVRAPAERLLDAALTDTFTINNVQTHIGIYGRNLTNDVGPATAFTVAGLFSYATAREPRTYGVTIGCKF